jgi:hypothetical protein
MRPLALLLLPLIVAPVVGAPAPFPKTERRGDVGNDLPKLQGTWVREDSYFWDGNGWRRLAIAGIPRFEISGDRIKWADDATQTGTLSLRGHATGH